MARLIRDRKVSPVEAAEAALRAVDLLNPDINAMCTVDAAQVRKDARNAEAQIARGEVIGPLHGVPLAVKDLIFTKGLRTTGGSLAYRQFVPDQDDVSVARVRAAGAIILGKTNVPVFGFGPATANQLFGVTRNPWRTTKTPGGSSGGSAAAVASGMCSIALGSDGGGSIRVPSSFCGVFGFKPTFGLIPLFPSCRDARYPGFSGWETLEHIGPVTRTVADAGLMLEVMAGPDRRDRHSIPRTISTYAQIQPLDVERVRVGWSCQFGTHTRVDNVVRDSVAYAADLFERMGASVEAVEVDIPDIARAFETLVAVEADMPALQALGTANPGCLNARIERMLSARWSFTQVSKAIGVRKHVQDKLAMLFEHVDLLLTPTVPCVAFDIGPDPAATTPVDSKGRAVNLSWFTSPFNLTGNPAASLPCGWTEGGLPIGLQVVGRRLEDELVLSASRAFEDARPWTNRRPNA